MEIGDKKQITLGHLVKAGEVRGMICHMPYSTSKLLMVSIKLNNFHKAMMGTYA